ncbi:hypothetical protein ACS0TY_036592 [Phlomoides rotata]
MALRKKPKVDRDDHNHEPRVGDDTVTPGLDDTMTYNKRGRTNMYYLYKDRITGVIKDVDFDKLGRPIRENDTKLQSYIGVLAREKVKITYPTWKHVPKDVKEQIWKAVTLTFNVSPAWKKSCLSSAGSKWRTFKTTLTKEYVYKRIDTPYLNIPPDGSNIDLNVWKDFVISRLSDKFKQMSDEHKELAKLNKWPHNLSRKGYARYASENVSWFYREKKNSDPEYEVEGGILSQALESTEHSGRVRGIGGHVIPSSYVYLHNNKLSNNELCKQHEMELMTQRKRNIEQDERIRRLEEQIFKNHGNKIEIEELGSCTGKVSTSQTSIDVKLIGDVGVKLVDDVGVKLVDDDVAKLVGDDDDIRLVDEMMGLENDKKLKVKSVALILESGKNIVAYGTIIKVDDPLVPKNCMCISIEKAEDKSAILPFPTGDCLTIDDAIGSHVTWPMHLMKLHDQVI